jgi:hypothetical protein
LGRRWNSWNRKMSLSEPRVYRRDGKQRVVCVCVCGSSCTCKPLWAGTLLERKRYPVANFSRLFVTRLPIDNAECV